MGVGFSSSTQPKRAIALPDDIDGILTNQVIHGQKWQILDLALSNQETVEGIAVMVREGSDLENVGHFYRQGHKSIGGQTGWDVGFGGFWKRKFTCTFFDYVL
jgi:hypothetical protein